MIVTLLLILLSTGCLLLGLVVSRGLQRQPRCARRGFVNIHEAHRAWLRSLRLTEPEHFRALEPLIVSGHPGRQVGRLVLGSAEQRRTVYLKREQGVRFTTRLRNFLSGFGWVSRSVREAQVLQALERDNLPAPRWLATGEDGHGNAFLLIDEVPESISLTAMLQSCRGRQRRELAARLGTTLARLHEAGFFHRDLYAKHVLVGLGGNDLCLLDWQRAWRGAWLSSAARIRDLACLHATIPDDLAGPRERLACLRGYLGPNGQRTVLRKLLAGVEARTQLLRRRRHIREKRQLPTVEQQAWLRLDGQALCITPALVEMIGEQPLDWLNLDHQPLPAGATSSQRWLTMPGDCRVRLVRQRQRIGSWRTWFCKMMGRPIVSPLQRQATLLWRLERHGVTTPRLLAAGERQQGRMVDSFLLCEPLEPVCRLEAWLSWPDASGQRAEVFQQAGLLLARLHDACCYLARPACSLVVRIDPRTRRALGVGLADLTGIVVERRPCRIRAQRDLAAFRAFCALSADDAEWWPHVERGYSALLLPPSCVAASFPTCRLGKHPSASWETCRHERPARWETCRHERPASWETCRHERPASWETCRHERGGATSLWRRLLHGCSRLHHRSDWQRSAGPDWPQRIMQIDVTDDFHAKQGRSTCRWLLPANQGDKRLAVYLKRHYRLPVWRNWLATLWPSCDWSPAMQEYHHLQWAREQGVPVPATVAAGEFIGPWGKLQSFLAVEELTEMVPLHRAIPEASSRLAPDLFRRWKRGLAAEMARLARLLHDRRHFHKDLYLCHFFIHQDDATRLPESWRGRVVLIDLHRLAHHRWTWWWWLLKDLAQLLYSSEVPGVTLRDQLAFWKHYRGPAGRGIGARWLRRLVVLRWQRYRAHNLRKQAQRDHK